MLKDRRCHHLQTSPDLSFREHRWPSTLARLSEKFTPGPETASVVPGASNWGVRTPDDAGAWINEGISVWGP